MNSKQLIKSFSIYGLFGTTDVHIPFDDDVKILVGENGIGKTQVLNIFYYVLERQFSKLSSFEFNKIVIEFSKNKVVVEKSDLGYNEIHDRILKLIGSDRIKDFQKNLLLFDGSDAGLFNFIASKLSLSKHEVFKIMSDFPNYDNTSVKDTSHIKKNLEEALGIGTENEVCTMYFPTFRRVEEDLHNLGYEKNIRRNKEDRRLIHFGMEDVQSRFNEIQEKIDSFLKDGFSKISSEILNQLVKGFSDVNHDILNKINKEDIEIILARVGKEVAASEKDKIRKIVTNKTLAQDINNLSLMYFLQKLIEIYEKQRELDNSIKKFQAVCNKYLVDKEVFYDESAIKIYIKSHINQKEIPLSKLSSGEKQIISIFTKMYLAKENNNFIVLFDEPELSLSMLWQKQLLPDIYNSGKCSFMLAVTHSPFIFENELDKYAVGLSEYMQHISIKDETNTLISL